VSARRRGLARVSGPARLACAFVLALSMGGCAAPPIQNGAGACPNNLGSSIKNFCVVTPGVLWRGARPDQIGAAWLMEHGVRTIVNLELILDDKPAFARAVLADTNVHQAAYFRIHDWEPLPILAPSLVDDHVAHFLAIVGQQTGQQATPVYVHCRSGVNRTGLMVAAYRVLIEGAGNEQAIGEMGRYRGQWFEADQAYIRGLSPQRRNEIRRKAMEWIPKYAKDGQIDCAGGKCAVTEQPSGAR
jgi:hypothetical protein